MSGDGIDRGGVKAPRTLFSLGRPSAKRPPEAGSAIDAADEGTLEEVDAEVAVDEPEIMYACGACSALLPSGAAFCGECGTPVAMDDDEPVEDGMLDELTDLEEPGASQPLAAPDPVEDLGEKSRTGSQTAVQESAPEGVAEETPVTDPGAVVAGGVAAGAGGPILDSQRGPGSSHEGQADQWAAAAAGQGIDHQSGQQVDQGAGGQRGAGQYGGAPAFDPNTTTDLSPHIEAAETASVQPESPPAEPAAVLYADPSMAEPLPPKAEGSWSVSEPVLGHAHDGPPHVESLDGTDPGEVGAGPAAAGAVAGAVAGTTAADPITAPMDAVDTAASSSGDTSWTVSPEGDTANDTVRVPPGLVGTTAPAMPYGAGPVESSNKGNKALLVAAVVVVAVLVLGGLAFALTRGGGSDVATSQASTTSVTAKKSDGGAATSSIPSTTASTTASTGAPSSTAPDTTSAPSSTDTSTAPTASGPTTAPTVRSTVTQPPTQPNQPTQPTSPPPTQVQPAQISFFGQPSYRLGRGGSASFNVQNNGGSTGDFQCSGNGVQIAPTSGSLNPGASQSVVIQDFRNAGAKYTFSCVGAGGGRFSAEVIVD